MPSLKLVIFRAEGRTCKVKTDYRYCSICCTVAYDESLVANSTELSFKWVDIRKIIPDLQIDTFGKTELRDLSATRKTKRNQRSTQGLEGHGQRAFYIAQLTALQAIDFLDTPISPINAKAYEVTRKTISFMEADDLLYERIEAMQALIEKGHLYDLYQEEIGYFPF